MAYETHENRLTFLPTDSSSYRQARFGRNLRCDAKDTVFSHTSDSYASREWPAGHGRHRQACSQVLDVCSSRTIQSTTYCLRIKLGHDTHWHERKITAVHTDLLPNNNLLCIVVNIKVTQQSSSKTDGFAPASGKAQQAGLARDTHVELLLGGRFAISLAAGPSQPSC